MPSSVPEPAPEVAAAFCGPGAPLMHRLRWLVYAAAAQALGVGELEESLKWGQPSYAPKRARVGSSVRLGARPDGKAAAYFICHTGLVDEFRQIYPDDFVFEGNRALVFDADLPVAADAFCHCVAMALTYHRRKKVR